MKLKLKILLMLLFLMAQGVAQINKPIGINISGVKDYSTELTFTDAFKQCRKWISSNASGGGPWDTQISVPLNSNGYPLEIPYNDGINAPQLLKSLMLWDIGSAVPLGMYRLKASGTGQIRLSFGAAGVYTCPVDTLVNVTGQVMLEIMQSDVANPVNDIHFILPNYVNTYQTQVFTDELIDFLEDFQVIRFMDFTQTNGSSNVSWSDRTTPSFYSQSNQRGVAWEYVIALANQTQKDIWINIPHLADDTYIQQLATLLDSTLNPTSKIYLEYSNEVWNSGFSQHMDCANLGQNLGYTGQSWERAWKYTAKRSADVFKIFEDVMSNDQRLIKIIPSQGANSWLSNQLITYFNDPIYNPNQVTADALAIGPYFGYPVANDIVNNGLVNTITIPQIMQELQNSLTDAFQYISSNKVVADNYNLKLLAYEGGQHLVGTGNNLNNDTLTAKLIATNHDAALQALYCTYLNYWYDTVGALFCHFSSHGTYSKYGSWGVRENFQDTLNPKYLALQNCVFNANIISSNQNIEEDNLLLLYPNPANDWVIIEDLEKSSEVFNYLLYDIAGRVVLAGKSLFNEEISLTALQQGSYTIEILENGKRSYRKLLKL